MKTRKTGIMGGTFNPVHMGHLLLAENAREQAELDQVIFMPSGQSYMKREMHILKPEERMRLVELSIAGNPYFSVSDMEILRRGYTYTYETLEQLSRENPCTEYYFITGADCLFTIEKWKHPERIFAGCTLMAAARSSAGYQELEAQAAHLGYKFGARIILMETPRIDISSTDIRERIRKGRSIRYMVAEKAERYIYEKQLFICQEDTDETGR